MSWLRRLILAQPVEAEPQGDGPDAKPLNEGLPHFSWKIVERPHAKRGFWWYVGASLLLLALVWYGIRYDNILLAVLAVMAGVVSVLIHQRGPLHYSFTVSEGGVRRGPYFYPYKELREFWIIYEPPIRTLYIEFRNPLKGRLSIDLSEQNPVHVREALLLYLPENTKREDESLSDKLERTFRL